MIKAVIIKQILCGEEIFLEGDKVKIRMKDEYTRGHNDRKKVYIGEISTITNDGFFLWYDNVSVPLSTDEMESIERVIDL